MTFLTPLGLLGLLGIVGLIIIYIIKPNYQQKFITSTFIWKLSLKYRKKKIPISKLRNLLLILCQVLILTACALILTQPNKVIKEEIKEPEVIAIIDSSASMRAISNDETRFERAVAKVQALAKDTFDKKGIVSVILANEQPAYLQQRVEVSGQKNLSTRLSDLIPENKDLDCSYAASDIDGAIALCEEVLLENPKANIYLYTDTDYSYVPKEVTLVNVSAEEEWNASILNAKSVFEDPYYLFVVEVACYGRDTTLDVELSIDGANALNSEDEGEEMEPVSTPVDCVGDQTMSVAFVSNPYTKDSDEYMEYEARIEKSYSVVLWMQKRISSYKAVNVSIQENDSFKQDNIFEMYDGLREVIRIQYASEKPNVFWPAALAQLRKSNVGKWDIEVTQVKKGEEPAIQGFDFYIFEHTIPDELPTDGVCLLTNPDEIATKYGARVGGIATSNKGFSLEATDEQHPILKNISLDRIGVYRYTQMILNDSYTSIIEHEKYSLLSIRDEEDVKIAIMPFSLHYSDIAVTEIFPLLVYNVFEYFFPQTVKANSFEVNERVELNARGTELKVEGYDYDKTFNTFPSYITVNTPGSYSLSQTTFAGKDVLEKIFVTIPKDECNIKKKGEAIADPYRLDDKSDFLEDLLVYIAAALVALLFIEWWLKGRDSM